MSKKIIFSVLVFGVLVVLGLVVFVKQHQKTHTPEWRCLGDNEEAGFYDRLAQFKIAEGIPEKYPLEIFIRDKTTKAELSKFRVEDIKESYHPVEVRICGVYVLRQFNYDSKKSEKNIGYRNEFWRYDYLGVGEKLVLLSEKPDEYVSYYNSDFRVDPLERYVVLEKGYLGEKDYALIIKDMGTKEDVYTLSYQKLFQEHPEITGGFNMRDWSADGRYFWGDIFYGADVSAYFRIDTQNWTYELFDAPEGQMGGEQLNTENGWVTHHTDLVWTGFADMQEDIKTEHRQQGIGTKFYLYNLLTGEKVLVYETDEPMWFTKPKWLSATEVEYELPSGEKKIYKLDQG
ncbi:MAG: hypothetical protein V1936_02385 [Patescibacteria group bacterium]